jgi:hypothetical protein
MYILAVYLGILGFVIGALILIGSIVMAAVAVAQINRSPDTYGGRGLAMTAMVLGIILSALLFFNLWIIAGL